MEKRKVFNKMDLIYISIFLIIALLIFAFTHFNDDNKTCAEITYNGKVAMTIDLLSAKDKTFILPENENVHFQIKEHKIRFVNVNCSDKLCENVGFIYKPNQIAVCLPNKTTVKIIGITDDMDMIVN